MINETLIILLEFFQKKLQNLEGNKGKIKIAITVNILYKMEKEIMVTKIKSESSQNVYCFLL